MGKNAITITTIAVLLLGAISLTSLITQSNKSSMPYIDSGRQTPQVATDGTEDDSVASYRLGSAEERAAIDATQYTVVEYIRPIAGESSSDRTKRLSRYAAPENTFTTSPPVLTDSSSRIVLLSTTWYPLTDAPAFIAHLRATDSAGRQATFAYVIQFSEHQGVWMVDSITPSPQPYMEAPQ